MKIAGSYGSLIRGVSQQAPEVRIDGQHTEQVNMLSDPVAGLTRRRGTIFKALQSLAGYTSAQADAALGGFSGYREIEHSAGGKDYVILMRDKANLNTAPNSLPPVMAYNRTDNVWLTVAWNDAGQSGVVNNNGISATVSVGQYLLFGVNNLPCSMSNTAVYGTSAAHKVVIWVRGGAYNRTYKVTMPGGASFSYTTPDATVAGSAAQIAPSYIAQQLALAGSSAGFGTYAVNGSHVYFGNITYSSGNDVSVTDGGDGSLIRAVYDTVGSVDQLPLMGIHGQIVRVQPGPDSVFYVQANTKGGAAAGLAETVWREAAGTIQGSGFTGLGRARVSGSTLYIGYSAPGNATGLVHMPTPPQPIPPFVASTVGDTLSNPAPRWVNGQISFLAIFQDRLLVGCGAEIAVSGAGDYLNFFRSTVVTVVASDPFAMVAQGGEDDTLRVSTPYNRNLVIFGDKRQYVISGTVALTPTSPNITIMTVYPDATECRPVAAGGQIFYARNREGSVGIHQIQPGQYVESAESFPASAQIATYIPAPACVLETVAGTPALLIVRSRSTGNGLYVFSYVDQPDGRKQDAWYRWEFDAQCGSLLGMKNTPNGLLLFWARKTNGNLFLVADLLPLSTADSTLPFLDSMRPVTNIAAGITATQAGWYCAFDKPSGKFLIGGDLATNTASLQAAYPTKVDNLWVGLPFDSYVVATNPYARDQQKKALLTGRTVVTTKHISTRASSGVDWEVTSRGVVTAGSFNGRHIGDPTNIVGSVPISDAIVSVPIGRETREYSLKIKARKWFPLNLIGFEWTGQSFNRTPRA